ncbi:MAG TPA: biotin/lipoyl-containing protein, partial [Gemmatimonadaceae bacterium]|nr:biotin/lipoyl-containing protein [Gemmatimonadaceae bacterium]
MATKVTMEALSPTMEEGRLVKWVKNEGDAVKTGDVLAEVETDKAVMELVARADGILRKRLANEGDASPVGTLLGVIAAADENIDALVGGGAAAPAPAAPAAAAADSGENTDPANEAVAETKETAVASAVPDTPAQAQGDASTPPQEKVQATAQAAPTRPAAAPPRPPTRPPQQGNGARPAANTQSGGRQRSSPLARRL